MNIIKNRMEDDRLNNYLVTHIYREIFLLILKMKKSFSVLEYNATNFYI